MKRLANIMLALALVSCVEGVDYSAENGKKKEHLAIKRIWGGTETWRTAGGFEWTGDRVENTAQLIQAGAAIGTMGLQALIKYIGDVTTRLADANLTLRQRDQLMSNLRLAQSELAARAGVTTEAIRAAPQQVGPINVNAP